MHMQRFLSVFALLFVVAACALAAGRPAVLFATGWVHTSYVVKPLVAQGIEVDVCKTGELAARLATGKYNVVVVGTVNDPDRKTLDDFLARGGGVFVCNPQYYATEKDWDKTNHWLTQLGAHPRWEVLADSDKANVVRDPMGCTLSWSDQIAAPVNDGVHGVLTLMWNGTTGCEPPMSYTFGPEWNVAVKGAATMHGVPEVRNDVGLQPWIPTEAVKASPGLMGLREVGKGRLAVMPIRDYWIFTPPTNCPTAEAMLTAGAGGKASDWLRVFANSFRWLAAPSLVAGMGGATTPEPVLNPPVQVWDAPPLIDWTHEKPMNALPDEPQVKGLIGARTALSSGSGTVAEYVKAAKAAGLQYIVFLEDSLKMNQAKWDQLVKQCTESSDAAFLAVPGLTYEDAQGNHHYAFADQVKFPKPSMLLPDGRLATTQSYRTRAFFDYDNEYLEQKAIRGYWDHKANNLHVADYKLYNSFPIMTFDDGKPVDNALHEFLYLQGIGGCQAALAFEMMSSPAMVAQRAAEGWKVVCHRTLSDLNGKWFNGAWSFSGSGSQYITNGPSILLWDSPNRLCEPHGEWWRPDIWEYRLRLRVASDVGLKTVTLFDGARQVLRRWHPDGAKTFAQELVLANCQQLGPTLVVEDMHGHRAISMSFWNRNLNMEEFFCSDRCNILGNCRLKSRDGVQTWTMTSFMANMGLTPSKGQLNMAAAPAVNLTRNSPTLPIDGAPAGYPTKNLYFNPQIPGELRNLFAYPQSYLIGPEISCGQADIKLGYDPAEEGAKTTPLGHPYQQPQIATGNSWSSWHRLVPTQKVTGWLRTYACNWIPGDNFRIGWHEASLTAIAPITLEKGVPFTGSEGILWQNGKQLATPDTKLATGDFNRGTFVTLEDRGGAVLLIGMTDGVKYRYHGGNIDLSYDPGKPALAVGDTLRYAVAFAGAGGGTTTAQMVDFAKKYGIFTPGTAGYTPVVTSGKVIDNYLLWRVDALGSAVQARIPKAEMPGFLPVSIEGLNSNWSVQMLDKARPWPNVRALPIRDGRAFAEVDLVPADVDLFLGHPITADHPEVKILVSWLSPGHWYVEAHNPTAKSLRVTLKSTPGWTPFTFQQTITLPAGHSRIWTVAETK